MPVPSPANLSRLITIPREKTLFLSINRFERKKNLALALYAFAIMRKKYPADRWLNFHLVMAGTFALLTLGGYDPRVVENVEHLQELQQICGHLDLTASVTFLPSFSEFERAELLHRALCLLYTPECKPPLTPAEHFGIVPVEAMYARKPVIACDSGGPLETVTEETGFLCKSNPKSFSQAMRRLVDVGSSTDRRSPRLLSAWVRLGGGASSSSSHSPTLPTASTQLLRPLSRRRSRPVGHSPTSSLSFLLLSP